MYSKKLVTLNILLVRKELNFLVLFAIISLSQESAPLTCILDQHIGFTEQ